MRDLVKRYLLGIVVCTIALSSTLLTLAPSASADAPHEIRNAAEAIPQLSEIGQTYKSWSLFLVCNPAWVLPESTRRLGELYQNFQAFGKAIGPAHAAVWFGVPSANDKQVQVDVLRSAAFCESLKLAPSGSPYIVITTEYPGSGRLDQYPASFPTKLSAVAVIGMAGKNVDEITKLLTALADNLLLNKMSSLDAQNEEWWRGLERAYDGLRTSVVGVSKGLTIRLKTPFFDLEKST